MDLSKRVLDQLVELMQRDGLDRLHLRLEDLDIDLRMTLDQASPTSTAAQPPAATPAGSAAAEHVRARTEEVPANVRKVLAPLVGVFYQAPAPGAQPYVSSGDFVTKGQVLCILEAMKLMNEIVSEFDGKIARVCANDGELVALHQELYWIET